jgi:hypothetical protein
MLNIHDQIAIDAARANFQARRDGPIPAEKLARLQSFIDSATNAFFESLPSSFEYLGKTYPLMIDIERARVAIFENMAAEKSMLVTLICSPDEQSGGQNR